MILYASVIGFAVPFILKGGFMRVFERPIVDFVPLPYIVESRFD